MSRNRIPCYRCNKKTVSTLDRIDKVDFTCRSCGATWTERRSDYETDFAIASANSEAEAGVSPTKVRTYHGNRWRVSEIGPSVGELASVEVTADSEEEARWKGLYKLFDIVPAMLDGLSVEVTPL